MSIRSDLSVGPWEAPKKLENSEGMCWHRVLEFALSSQLLLCTSSIFWRWASSPHRKNISLMEMWKMVDDIMQTRYVELKDPQVMWKLFRDSVYKARG